MQENDIILELRNVDKGFNRGTVNETILFSGFGLSVERGEFISVVGSNGSGKTTMLNIISGSTMIDGGSVLLEGRDITKLPEHKKAAKIGRVFQNPAVGTVPGMTIFENLSIAANKGSSYGMAPALNRKNHKRFRELVASLGLGLEDKMDIPVGLLSGGQRQALSLLMSTMTPIDILLLDEHTAALDPKTAEVIMTLTDRLVREMNLTTIMVTHNLRYAVEYGNRLLMMHNGHIVLDKAGEEKAGCSIDNLLTLFNEISIECGN